MSVTNLFYFLEGEREGWELINRWNLIEFWLWLKCNEYLLPFQHDLAYFILHKQSEVKSLKVVKENYSN